MSISMYHMNVPFASNEDVKSKGAKWDKVTKKWYVDNPGSYEACREWFGSVPNPWGKRDWKYIPYASRHMARELHYVFDPVSRSWFLPSPEERAAYLAAQANSSEDPSEDQSPKDPNFNHPLDWVG